MSDFESENSRFVKQFRHGIKCIRHDIHFHENTASENETRVIESLFTPYTDKPIAPSDYATTEYDNEDPD